MDALAQIASIPILQAFLLVLIIGIAERMGIPIIAGLKSLMKLEDNKEVKRLSSYYNHDLTGALGGIDGKLDQVIEAEREEHRANESMREIQRDIASLLREFKEYGIKIRKDV